MSGKIRDIVFFLASILCLVIIIFYNLFFQKIEEAELEVEHDELVVIDAKYGIGLENYDVYYGTVLRGETLGAILLKHGITAYQIDKISRMSSDTFNVTRINIGRPYAVFKDTLSDSIPKTDFFVYENGTVFYTVYDFTVPDTIIIKKHQKEIDTVTKTASGIIKSSLWNSIVGQGLPWGLAIAMTQTFAWTVDFYALKRKDAFKVIYDEYYVDNKSIGVGEIKAGLFNHHGKDLWAIPFEQNGIKGFYDTLGNNTRKTFMKAPLKYTRVSSRYSSARMHPIHNRPRAHLAVDFAAPTGTPVYAASDGVVIKRAYGAGPGYYIKIRHNSIYSTVYMHFSRFGKYHVGDFVSQGDIIGYVGSTGMSTGPHLHYEIHENGQRIDPLKFEPPPAEPIGVEYMKQFNKHKRKWIEKINEIEL